MRGGMSILNRRIIAVAAICLVGAAGQGARAAAVLSENFGTCSDGNLTGQNSWATQVAGTADTGQVKVTSHALSMAPTVSGTTLEIVKKPLGQTFSTAGTSIYYAMDINVTGAATGGDWVAGFSPNNNSYGGKLFVKKTSSTATTYLLGWYVGAGSSSVQYGTTALDFNTPVRVVVRYDFVSGTNNDTGAIYVIPSGQTDVSNESSFVYLSTGTFAAQADIANVSAIDFHRGGTNGPTMTMDNLSVGSWNDVAAVPEPTVASALGASALLLYRRRQS